MKCPLKSWQSHFNSKWPSRVEIDLTLYWTLAQGVVMMVGVFLPGPAPMLFSMYICSLGLMLGCLAGFSKASHSHSMYQQTPMQP